jgi:glucarate dehydratase
MAGVLEAFDIEAGLHSGGELGLSQAANLHLAASIPDQKIAIDAMYFNFRDDILTERFVADKDKLVVPLKPGLGVTPDLDKIERYQVREVEGAYLNSERPGWFPMKPAY